MGPLPPGQTVPIPCQGNKVNGGKNVRSPSSSGEVEKPGATQIYHTNY